MNLYQIDSTSVGGNYTAPLLLGVSKRSLLDAQHATPAHAAFSGWDADTSFTLAPSLTQASPEMLRAHLCYCEFLSHISLRSL